MARSKSQNQWLTVTFLLLEAVLYALILMGQWVVSAQYAAVSLCFVFVLLHLRQANYFILFGLLGTLAADWFLVVHRPQEKLTAMLCFLVVQTAYALLLHRRVRRRGFLIARVIALLVAEVVALVVLREKIDALAMVSMAYYAMLIMNIACAFKSYKKQPLLAWALVLFFLCDTVVGLQVASAGYLILPAWLNNAIFCGLPLDWLFYLPSQVMLAFCGKKNR